MRNSRKRFRTVSRSTRARSHTGRSKQRRERPLVFRAMLGYKRTCPALDDREDTAMNKTRTAGFIVVFVIAVASGPAPRADGDAHITVKEDVVYGRVQGAGLLADIAYPEGKGPFPAVISVHGGRWRAGSRTDASSIKVGEWAGFGFFAMS